MKIFHKILFVLAAIIISLYLIIFYINHTFIPLRLKAFIENNLSEQTQGDVDIESLRFALTKGFILNNIRIYEGPRENNKFIFRAKSISFAVIFLPSFRKQRIIMPRISLDEPYLRLERLEDASWNISHLITKKDSKEKASRLQLIVKSLYFDNGELLFLDYYKERNFSKAVSRMRGTIGLSLPNSLALNCTAKIEDTPVKIAVRFTPPKSRLSIGLEAKDLGLADYSSFYLSGDIAKIYKGSTELSLKINISNFKDVDIKGNASIQGLNADLNSATLNGNYKLSGVASFNIEDLLNLKYNLKLELDNARATTKFKLLKKIDNIEGTLSLSEKSWVAKRLSCLAYNSPVSITGEVRNPHKDFVADIGLKSTLLLKEVSANLGMDLKAGEAEIDTKISYEKDESYSISGRAEIKGLNLKQKDIIIGGDFSISGQSSGKVGSWENIDYKGSVGFGNATIESAGLLPLISNVSGNADFSRKHIIIKNFNGTAADTKVSLKGSIDYQQKEPDFNLTLKTGELSLPKFLSTLPKDIRAKFKDIDAKGSCSLNINFTGKAGRRDTFAYKGNVLLKGCELGFGYWPYEISGIDCDIRFEKDKVIWQDLYFNIKGLRYHSYGSLANLAEPVISLSLKSKEADAVAEIKVDKDNIINISKLDGRYYNSTFSIKGKIKDIKNAYADISGVVYLNLKDIPYIFSAKSDSLRKLKPDGNLKLTFDMNGPLKEPAEWTLFAEATTGAIYIWGLRFGDFYFDYRMKDRFIDMPVITAHLYDGIININSRANLKTPEQPYIINIDIKDIDLHKLVKDTELKDKRIKGAFAAKSVLNGYLSKKGSLQGSGWLQVSDGYLWEFPVMRGMMDIILMIPPEYVILTDAFGNFSVSDDRIYTEDFRMLSKAVSLLWIGSLGIDGTLDFNITGRFAENVIKQTTEPGKIASAILREAGSLIMEVRLTGTLADPKYQIVPFPLRRILKEKVVDRLNDIFGNILE